MKRSHAGWSRLTYGQWLMCMSHGGPDDVGAVDAVLVAKLLGLVEPFSGHVPQSALVTHSRLEVPECRHISGETNIHYSEH